MPFVLDSDDLFIGSYSSGVIRVLRNDKSHLEDTMLTTSSVTSSFSTVWEINTSSGDEELQVFYAVIYGKKLRELASDLYKDSYPTTNRQGFMYIRSASYEYYRANDLFGWLKYGVAPPFGNIWNRYDLYRKQIAINLVAKDVSLRDSKSQLEKLMEELSLCKKNSEEKENKCSNLEKRLEESETMLHNLEKLLKEKEKGSSYLEKNLEEKKIECSHLVKRLEECSEVEKSLAKKDGELQECRSQLKSKEAEVSFMARMMEKRPDHHAKDKLAPLDHQKHSQEHNKGMKEKNLEVIVSSNLGLEDKHRELMICKLLLEEKERDLKKICDQLLAERKQISALRVGMRSLVSYFKELHEGLHREVDYNFPLLTMSYEEYLPAMASDGGGSSALAPLSERHLRITEHPHNEDIDDEDKSSCMVKVR